MVTRQGRLRLLVELEKEKKYVQPHVVSHSESIEVVYAIGQRGSGKIGKGYSVETSNVFKETENLVQMKLSNLQHKICKVLTP